MIHYPIPPDVSKTHLPFSPATRVGNLLFVSGQASTDAEGNVVSDRFENEFHRTMQNIIKILAAAGTDLSRVCRVGGYIKHAEDFPRYNELYRQYFKPPYPARTTISNCLGKVLVEIDCIAVVDDG